MALSILRVRAAVPLLFAIAASVMLTGTAAAQPHRGAIRGVVTDATGAPIADAQIALVEVTTNASRSARSDEGGRFAVTLLPPGDYQLRVEAPGHRVHVADLKLGVHQRIRTDVRLEVGPVSSEVLVEAPLAPVRHETAAIGTIIDEQQVRDLPLDGRNFLELSLLAPGTAPAAQGSASSVRGDFAFTVAGGREDANGFQLDGVDNVDPKLNTVALRPPVDAIREFEVQTGGHEAPVGRYAAGHVNVVLKSGSNDLDGTAYGFFRSGVFDARNFFAPRDEPAPEYRRGQYGLSIGGPILTNRLFFFGDYEGTRLTEGITQVTSVPTLAERSGDFSATALAVPVNPLTGQPFPGNRIPELFQNPIGLAIAQLYPAPNRDAPLANFVSSPSQTDDVDQFDVRIDRPMAGRFDVTARYSFSDRRLHEPFSGPAFALVPGYGADLDRRAQNLVVGGVSVITPTLLNEARFGFTRVSAGVQPENAGVSVNRQVGLPELSDDPRDWGLSFITVTGYSPLGHEYNNPQASTTNAFQVTDTLTWSRGDHLLRAGFDLRAVQQEAFRDVQSRGQLTFASQGYTGNALADLLLGLPIFTVGARLDNPQRLRTENVGLFVQDSWRAGPGLTLSAGVRYELTSPPVDAGDRANIYDPATGSLVQVGTRGIPRAGYRTDRNNLAPRAGIVWSPGSTGETVLRGSYGLYYNQGALAPSEGLYFSDPYFHLDFFFPVPGVVDLTLFDPFPAGFPIPSPQSGFTFQRDLQTPMVHQWSAGVQRQLGSSRTIETVYVGSRGTHLITGRDLNQPLAPSAAPNLRPNPAFNDVIVLESNGRSRYDSLQLRFEQRSRRGLSGVASYTLGHARDDASGFFPSAGDPNFPQNSYDRAAEWGRASYDVRHRLSAGFVWEVPGPRGGGAAQALAGGWQVSGILTVQSGRPFTVALLPELDNSNTGRSSLGFGANDRPDVAGDPELDDRSAERWFDTSAFVIPPFGSFGDSGRNTVEGPGLANVNVAGIKSLALGGGVRLQARIEVFNLFNRANFNQPDPFVGSPTFGQVLSAQSPRRVQLGVRAIF